MSLILAYRVLYSEILKNLKERQFPKNTNGEYRSAAISWARTQESKPSAVLAKRQDIIVYFILYNFRLKRVYLYYVNMHYVL